MPGWGLANSDKRHSFICSLLGIRHVALAVNKMDLVGFDPERFDAIAGDYKRFTQHSLSLIKLLPFRCRHLKVIMLLNVLKERLGITDLR